MVSLVELYAPLNFADAISAEPALLEEEDLKRLHQAARSNVASYDRWSKTFDAPPDQFTPIGYQVFNAFFQCLASFLRTDWKSAEFNENKSALRVSIAAVRAAYDTEPLIIAHRKLIQVPATRSDGIPIADNSSEA